MDLIKTLLVYMMLVVGSAADAAPALTPPPASRPTATPYISPVITAAPVPTFFFPTARPTLVPTVIPTLAPTATPTAYTTLYVGDRGEEVRKLQRRLAELKYLDSTIDGVYGQKTKRAVERFQYYNGLTVDGIAGKATQRMLFESPYVVTAPPDITPAPTPTPTATPMVGVTVPVYYVDQNGLLLRRVNMTCYGTSTIYANNSNVGAGYTLSSASAVTVTVRNGVATPASVTFQYRKTNPPTQAPTTVIVPVYYMTDTGAILHQTSATLSRNAVTNVPVNLSLVPAHYRLISPTTVSVTVNGSGTPSPASVIFTFTNATPTPVPETKRAQIPVRYVNETGFLLNEASVTVEYGQSTVVYANAAMVQADYRLISQNPVFVSVDAFGTATPAVVIFTYSYQAPTAVPTRVPTPVPTAIPTMVPTPIPTAIPTPIPTAIPTAIPTMIPTPIPTAVPTEIPTPVPTQVPTPVPTEAPTAEPTEVPKGGLIPAGSHVGLNGMSYDLPWFRDDDGTPFVSLKALAKQAGWSYYGNGGSTILGHGVFAAYTADGIGTLSVDSQDCIKYGRVWEGDLYVSPDFFKPLGLRAIAQNDWLLLERIE